MEKKVSGDLRRVCSWWKRLDEPNLKQLENLLVCWYSSPKRHLWGRTCVSGTTGKTQDQSRSLVMLLRL